MNVLHIVGASMQGGAAKATYRIHKSLKKIGIKSKILVYESQLGDKDVITIPKTIKNRLFYIVRQLLECLIFKFYPKRKSVVLHTGLFGFDVTVLDEYKKADIINLHWINANFLSIKSLGKFDKPIVWTMHNVWPITGVCDHPIDCTNYKRGCGNCEQLGSNSNYDLSKLIFNKKKRLIPDHTKLVGVSSWLSQIAKESHLFKSFDIRTIANTIDSDDFFPINKSVAKKILNIKTNKKVISVGSTKLTDLYKGFNKFIESLNELDKDKYFLCFFGKVDDNSLYDGFGFEYKDFGYLHDNISLRLLYSASNVFVAPSTAESWGQTFAESMACGTPVVCFDATGQKDIVDHKVNGYRAIPYEAKDLANGIEWVINSPNYDDLCKNAINKITKAFNNEIIANQYLELYKSLL